jgi:hypothetical protein
MLSVQGVARPASLATVDEGTSRGTAGCRVSVAVGGSASSGYATVEAGTEPSTYPRCAPAPALRTLAISLAVPMNLEVADGWTRSGLVRLASGGAFTESAIWSQSAGPEGRPESAARDGYCERPETLVSAFVARTRALRIIDWYQSSVGPPLRITSRVIVEVGRSRRLAISA